MELFKCILDRVQQAFAPSMKAAVCMQSRFRGRQGRLYVKAIRAAIKVQRAYRCHVERKKFLGYKSAAVHVQAAVRGFQRRALYVADQRRRIGLQAEWRRFSVRLAFLRRKKAALRDRQASLLKHTYHKNKAAAEPLTRRYLALSRQQRTEVARQMSSCDMFSSESIYCLTGSRATTLQISAKQSKNHVPFIKAMQLFEKILDQVQPAADEVQPAADEVQPAADEVQPAADEVQPAVIIKIRHSLIGEGIDYKIMEKPEPPIDVQLRRNMGGKRKLKMATTATEATHKTKRSSVAVHVQPAADPVQSPWMPFITEMDYPVDEDEPNFDYGQPSFDDVAFDDGQQAFDDGQPAFDLDLP